MAKKRVSHTPHHPSEAQMDKDDAEFESKNATEGDESEDKKQRKERPVGYIVQTHGAILPVEAVRAQGDKKEEKIGDHTPLQVGDYVELPPSVAAQHQAAGVGLSLAETPKDAA